MKLDPKVVAELAIPFHPKAFLRVMPKVHAATPLGMGFGQSRFAAPDRSFQVIYLARNIATAVAETVVRNRFEGKVRRILDITEGRVPSHGVGRR
ncbi:MAG: RES domain-containing protein [Mesorhizobium sp.]|nr:MAG: RES domain-containing protein [Mesorhizobium sp.]